ncbi:PAS domain S-box protein [Halorubrum sp. JWXQ-INN 858]|uniref:histidine kinase N-terminal 7TM domain-containing protein n=1 Tax=Halorubrum sp. JWXQ-INN 858 TaxID=2690782 RepID=UPI0013F835BF|nr:histidine kinase N-terminal 7TM domain-containing protein [Halorubrum sp. JWXQ-INN 858]MWV65639.1 PAS domain S-box protein [Halorubrum sp. JWXQ-INN 858]
MLVDWEWHWTGHTVFLFVAAAALLSVAVAVWGKRDVTGRTAFLFLLGSMVFWTVAYGFQIAGANEATKVFWANVNHMAVAAVPVAWLCFALQFTGRKHVFTPRTVGALSVVPAIYTLLVWTNPTHQLIRETSGMRTVDGSSLLLLDQTFGPAFWLHAVYGYGLMATGTLLFAQLFVWAPSVYRRQVGLLLLGAIVPMATNIAFHADLYSPSDFDLTSFSFVATALLFFVAIYRYQMLDLVPIARETVVDTLTGGIIVVDRKHRVVDLNAAATTILGVHNATVIGSDIQQVFPELTGDEQLAGREVSTRREVVHEADGTSRTLAVTITAVSDVNQNPIGYTITIRDVTETRRLQAAVRSQLDEVLRVNRELELFTTAISHDLRAPARTTERYIDRVRRSEPDLSDEGKSILEVAQTNAEQMQSMLTALLEYSRISVEPDQFEPVALSAVIDRTLTSLQFSIEETEATVSIDELPTVQGVDHLLALLFQNLISNAIRYAGDSPPRIEIEAVSTETAHEITVTDSGVGIEERNLAHVFELFYTGSHDGGPSGTGAGLAICKKIVEEHRGTVTIESTVGHGTEVTVRLPIDP